MQHPRYRYFFYFTFFFFFSLVACTDTDGEIDEPNDGTLYFDYRIWGEEESLDMTVKLQYRIGGAGGQTYMFEAPGKVEFDSTELTPDSSRMNGYHYETRVPIEALMGKHSIAYTNPGGKRTEHFFEFEPFTLKTDVGPIVRRGDIEFSFDGLKENAILRVMMTDTAMFSEGIIRVDTIRSGVLKITREELANLRNGPINFGVYEEDERVIREDGKRKGKIAISYGLNREFVLTD